jgi:predicted AlkP superfamily pyrophosphatase or phosphodiesterase
MRARWLRNSVLGVATATAGISFAAPGSAPAPRPKLIVAIAVDQFSTDLFNEYRPFFTGGLKRLLQGAVFPRGHQSHAATETCPGHSTILTGSRPSRTGIIANDWQNPNAPRVGKDGKPSYDVYCAEDPNVPGTTSSNYVVSPTQLRVPTLGDRLKAVDPATRVFSVSGKDRAAVMMGGPNADLSLWWDGKAFVTYKNSKAVLPTGLASINARAASAVATPKLVAFPKACENHARTVALSATASVGTLALRKKDNERGWRATPEFDQMTLDVGLAGLREMKLGQGPTTDVFAISFSATDYTGHSFGTSGAEMCAQIFALDALLGKMFIALDKSGVDYAVVLTGDHGGHDLPERNKTSGLPSAQRVDPKLSAVAMGKVIAAQFGLDGSALIGRSAFGDMYLAPNVPQEKRAVVRDAAVAAYRAHPQVAAVFTRDDLLKAPAPSGPVDEWSLLSRAKASFDAERSGDFLVLLNPYVTPIPDASFGYVATHGSPWGYDRRVPIVFWWKNIAPFEQPNAVETVDILPTLASLIGLSIPPAEIDGRCLDVLVGPASNCP